MRIFGGRSDGPLRRMMIQDEWKEGKCETNLEECLDCLFSLTRVGVANQSEGVEEKKIVLAGVSVAWLLPDIRPGRKKERILRFRKLSFLVVTI